jgi:23S rRNA (guanosine2251-2'-O)-methyltransferase
MTMLTLIYGFHAVTSRVKTNPDSVHEVLLDEKRVDARAQTLRSVLGETKVKLSVVKHSALDELVSNGRHQGVVARVEPVKLPKFIDEVLDQLDAAKVDPLLIVLDGITDPHNLGAVLRVADAAGAHAVIAPKDRSVSVNATVAKVASGAAETIPFITVTNLARTLRELKERGVWLVGTSDHAPSDLYHAKLTGPLAWVMGAEGDGIRRLTAELCDGTVSIPMAGSVESLNVSVATGVCLYETVRQRSSRA